MYVRKEAVLSSQIEGTQASLGDLLKEEAQVFDPMRPDDTNEIINYVKAMNHGLERVKSLPLSNRLIRETHGILMDNVRSQYQSPGEFRTSQNWIGSPGCTLRDAKFVPPPPSELPALLSELEKCIHADDDLPMLVKIALVHAHFETLHPFLDGNGRVGRLLITFQLCEREIIQKPVLYLSHYLKQHRETYYRLLQGTRDDGEWEDWIGFFLKGVTEVSNQATEMVRRIVQLREDHRQKIIENLGMGTANGLRLLETLYKRPIFSVSDITRDIGLSPQASNNLANRLEQLEIVGEITGQQRYRMFSYTSYIAIFTD